MSTFTFLWILRTAENTWMNKYLSYSIVMFFLIRLYEKVKRDNKLFFFSMSRKCGKRMSRKCGCVSHIFLFIQERENICIELSPIIPCYDGNWCKTPCFSISYLERFSTMYCRTGIFRKRAIFWIWLIWIFGKVHMGFAIGGFGWI